MTIHEAQQRLIFQLYDIYDNREAANIADLVMENITGWKKIDRILNKQLPLLPDKVELLEKYTADLLLHKPLQYILNESWFFELKLFVNEHVLIPRPETEELVEWILSQVKSRRKPNEGTELSRLAILDIGTGSGCIAIALKKHLPSVEIIACDISKNALEVAQRNALDLEADIGFLHVNFLDDTQWQQLPSFDIIVSNPPYIPLKGKVGMRPNVVQYEPHLALFVEDTDPLIFYNAIAEFSREKLNVNGSIFAEIHEELANDVKRVFEESDFGNIDLRKDMQGKDRMIRITK